MEVIFVLVHSIVSEDLKVKQLPVGHVQLVCSPSPIFDGQSKGSSSLDGMSKQLSRGTMTHPPGESSPQQGSPTARFRKFQTQHGKWKRRQHRVSPFVSLYFETSAQMESFRPEHLKSWTESLVPPYPKEADYPSVQVRTVDVATKVMTNRTEPAQLAV